MHPCPDKTRKSVTNRAWNSGKKKQVARVCRTTCLLRTTEKDNPNLSMPYHDLMHFGRTVYTIVYMQVIDAIGQVGYVELHCAAFSWSLAKQVTLPVVKADVKSEIGSLTQRTRRSLIIYFDGKNVINRVRIYLMLRRRTFVGRVYCNHKSSITRSITASVICLCRNISIYIRTTGAQRFCFYRNLL